MLIRKSQICRLGLSKNNRPYIVPVSLGYDEKYTVWFFCLLSTRVPADLHVGAERARIVPGNNL